MHAKAGEASSIFALGVPSSSRLPLFKEQTALVSKTRRPRVGQRLGKYKLRKRLGRGATGDVFEAHDTVEARTVALKVAQDTPEAREDCRREIRIMAKLDHPAILELRNANEFDGHLVMAVPLANETLSDRLSRRMSPTRTLHYAEQILEGLAHAHERRVLHRDVKPANMLLFDDDVLKLADFGAARSPARTRFGTSVGTVGYMAPEQALGRSSPRSDVFCAGLVLYRMTSGALPEWPFTWPGPGRERLRRFGEAWKGFLHRALELHERKRYRDAGHMLDAFEAVRPKIERHLQRSAARRRRG